MIDQKEETKKEKFIETMPMMIQTHLIICVMHQQDCLLSCQLHPTFPPIVEGMWLTEL